MNFFENVKNGVSATVETISDAAQALAEKNRLNAQINRLKIVIKNENAILDKAYIALGKYFYDNPKPEISEDIENLREIVENSKARLKKAQDVYYSLLEKRTEQTVANSEIIAQDIEDITVACNTSDAPVQSAKAAQHAEKLGTFSQVDVVKAKADDNESADEDITVASTEEKDDVDEYIDAAEETINSDDTESDDSDIF